MTIDIEKIKARRKELEKECQRLDGFLALAAEFGSNGQPSQLPLVEAPAPASVAPAPQPEVNSAPTRTHSTGWRKAVLLSLAPGKLEFEEVSRALVTSQQRTREVLCSMISDGLCYVDDQGRVDLTPKGKEQAAWFQANPQYVIYHKRNRWAKS